MNKLETTKTILGVVGSVGATMISSTIMYPIVKMQTNPILKGVVWVGAFGINLGVGKFAENAIKTTIDEIVQAYNSDQAFVLHLA